MGRTQNTVLRENLIPDDAHPDEIELYVFSWQTVLPLARQAAETAYENAKVENEDEEIINAKLAHLQHCDTQINKAHQYLCEINDELNKGKDSELRIDQFSTTNPKHPQITISSLFSWAKEKYGFNIYQSHLIPTPTNQDILLPKNKELSNIKSNNLLITFALLVEAFAKTAPKYHKADGSPNVTNIAKELEKKDIPGQSEEAIKDRIEAAMKTKRTHT